VIDLLFKPPSVPTKEPLNFEAIPTHSTKIFLSWEDIPIDGRSGALTGYYIKYREYKKEKHDTVEVPFGFRRMIIRDLKPYMMYMIQIVGFNIIGEGPPEYVMMRTLEDVPGIPVPNVNVINYQSTYWWSITWEPIPADQANGILLGYELSYYNSFISDVAVGGEINKTVVRFNNYTFYHKVEGCKNYETYSVTLAGYTKKGTGPEPIYYARTCRCPKYLFANYYNKPPYLEVQSRGNLTGFFPILVHDFVVEACGSCQGYSKSILLYELSRTGKNPHKTNKSRLVEEIDETVDISFPYYAHTERVEVVPGGAFVALIPSPGCALIVRNEKLIEKFVLKLIALTLRIWPYLLVMYMIAAMFGIIIWFADQFENPDEFNLGNVFRGIFTGFWFTFVTMTSVGYGDLVPKSTAARLISIIWILTGMVLNSILLAYVTSTFTSVAESHTVELYNTKVGVLQYTYSHRYAVRRNAIVHANYTNISELLDGLKLKTVDIVLIDIYNMVGHNGSIESRDLKIKRLVDVNTAYGFIVSGMSRSLKLELDSMIFTRQQEIAPYIKIIDKTVPPITEQKKDDVTDYIFSKDSTPFIKSVKIIGFAIAISLFLGVMWTCGNVIKRRIRIDAVTYTKSLKELELLLQCFPINVRNSMLKLERFHDSELCQLSLMKRSVTRYVDEMGNAGTELKISYLWRRRLLDYVYNDSYDTASDTASVLNETTTV